MRVVALFKQAVQATEELYLEMVKVQTFPKDQNHPSKNYPRNPKKISFTWRQLKHGWGTGNKDAATIQRTAACLHMARRYRLDRSGRSRWQTQRRSPRLVTRKHIIALHDGCCFTRKGPQLEAEKFDKTHWFSKFCKKTMEKLLGI